MTDTKTPETKTVDVTVLEARVESLEVEVAELQRVLLSLGSALVAGGPPGSAPYVAWHREKMAPPAGATVPSSPSSSPPASVSSSGAPSGSTTAGGPEKAS